MAWTAPMTAVANTAFTAAQFNVHVRDNLLETAPAKAATPGGYFVTTGANSITERTAASTVVATSETTTSTAYTALATAGPSVTVTTGTSALVWIAARVGNDLDNSQSKVSFAVSGSTALGPSDDWAVVRDGEAGGVPSRRGSAHGVVLTSGVNTFTMKYSVGSGTGTFSDREIIVMPF